MLEVVGVKRVNYQKKDGSNARGYRLNCLDLDPSITPEQPVWGTPVESYYIKDETLCLKDNKELFQSLASPDKLIGRHIRPIPNRWGGLDGVVFVD